MPVVAQFDGVRIMFYTTEHPPPHFHAEFAEHVAVVDIRSAKITQGFLPIPQRRKVLAWTRKNRDRLLATFLAAVAREPVGRIE